ncbi:unnamed protein product [Cuscuta campestris]|uniref:Uncharacterized protein n=1 Tax=Cuscuta campestris TaxID=132261 RepID=A0A484MYW2_9ASTE|nr:unnamed protein product [Cuscuta campestris]
MNVLSRPNYACFSRLRLTDFTQKESLDLNPDSKEKIRLHPLSVALHGQPRGNPAGRKLQQPKSTDSTGSTEISFLLTTGQLQ